MQQEQHKKWLIFPVLILIVLLCGRMVQAAGEIRFAYQNRIGSVLPIVAVNKGFFSGQGLSVRPLRFTSGPACAEALYSGAADIGGMGDTAAIIMVARQPQFVIFTSHATGEHRHRLMVRQDNTLQGLHGLIGKRLAVKKGSSTHGGLLAVLSAAGVDPAEIELVDLDPPTMVTALQACSVDAFATSEPTPSVAEERGAKELLTLGGQGNAYPLFLLARREFLQQNREQMVRFVRALRQAQAYVRAHPEEIVAMMAAETGLSLSSARSAVHRHEYGLRSDTEIQAGLYRTARFLQQQKIIDRVPDLTIFMEEMFDQNDDEKELKTDNGTLP